MPRHIINRERPSAAHPKLVKKLAAELAGGKSKQPVILEELVPATQSRHVQVIWDEWASMPEETRADVILDAYRQVEGEEAASNITFAEGATPHEALALGMLPFTVQSMRKSTEALSSEAYLRVFRQELPNTLLGKKTDYLRYPTLDDAERAKQRLEEALPGSHWAVVEERDR